MADDSSSFGHGELGCFALSSVSDGARPQNEYSKQLRDLREAQKNGKAHGKVFVKGLFLLFAEDLIANVERHCSGWAEGTQGPYP